MSQSYIDGGRVGKDMVSCELTFLLYYYNYDYLTFLANKSLNTKGLTIYAYNHANK